MRTVRYNSIWVCLGFCLALIPMLALRDFTPMNELRYLSIADEALRDGTFWAFTNHGVPYADKPPLFLWCVMACRLLAGAHAGWLLVFAFSVLPAVGIVVVMDRWCASCLDSRWRPVASLMLLTSGLFAVAASILRMDMMMCLFIVLSLYAFRQMEESPEKDSGKWRWLFPVFLFLGLFTKGPFGVLIPLCVSTVFLALSGKLRTFFHFWGWRTWLPLAAGCGIWFGCVYAEWGTDYLDNLLFHQTIDRAVNAFHHKAPFYYYAVSSLYSLAPWTLLVIYAIVLSLRKRGKIKWDLRSFFLTTGLTVFLLLSCLSSKIQIYFLPAVPFLVFYCVMVVSEKGGDLWQRIALGLPSLAFTCVLPAVVLLRWNGCGIAFLSSDWIVVAAAALSAGGCVSLWYVFNGNDNLFVIDSVRSLGLAMLMAVFAAGWAMPEINPAIGYGSVCEKALEVASEVRGPLRFGSWRVTRPENMDVYLGKEIKEIPDDSIPRGTQGDTAFMVITPRRCFGDIPEGEKFEAGEYGIVLFD